MSRVTRNDVARRAGTSTAVVSYVINNGPRPVATATRARVEAAIAELGYQPDLVARALRGRRSNTIGMVVPDSSQAFFTELVHGVERAAYARGSLVLLGNAEFSAEHEDRYLESLTNMRVDGVLVARAEVRRDRPPVSQPVRGSTVPVVHLNNLAPPEDDATSVVLANAAGGRALTEHLLQHGYSRVGCLTGSAPTGAVAQRAQGWRAATRAAGHPAPVRRTALDRSRAREVVTRWLTGPDRPDAIMATADGLALDAIAAAHELGLRVPEDVAIVGFGGTKDAAGSWPSLTTAGHSFADFGEVAVQTLSEVAEHGRQPDVVLDVALQTRASCGCHEASGSTYA